MSSGKIRLSVDIGGTFTDVVLDNGGTRSSCKVPTTPARPEEGFLAGIDRVLVESNRTLGDIDILIHGTTLATNAIIERRGARTALINTQGFLDTLDIATESRYDQYDLMIDKPVPLVPRELRFSIPERIDALGQVRLVLDESAVDALIPRLSGCEAIAIAFLHSYVNPNHEIRAGELIQKRLPDANITLSHQVCPEIREYERTSTAVANAYVRPLIEGYLSRMKVELVQRGFRGVLYLVTSGGGLTTIETAMRFPVRLVESGPAGGAIFAADIAHRSGEARVLSFDMGGTTAKVCLIDDAKPRTSRVFEVDRMARFKKGSGLPLRIPVVELVEIGAGGCSIAHVDALKRVTVGPESASAVPGPACYGKGGNRATVTDADIVLGMIDPADFAGGTMTLDIAAAREAMTRDVGSFLDFSADTAAYAVYEIVCENMASAARVHAVELGADIRQYTMIAFGGAAPLHAARVAEKLGVTKIVVPLDAGVGSAVGFLSAPVAYEVVRSWRVLLDDLPPQRANAMLEEMSAEANGVVAPGSLGAALTERRVVFARYAGQGYEIPVALPEVDISTDFIPDLRSAFEQNYARYFGRIITGAPIETVTWAVTVSTDAPSCVNTVAPVLTGSIHETKYRNHYDGRSDQVKPIPAYSRVSLTIQDKIDGPAILTEPATSTFVPQGFTAQIDADGSLILRHTTAS